MGIVRLEGEKILLRQMTYEDTDKIVEWRNKILRLRDIIIG